MLKISKLETAQLPPDYRTLTSFGVIPTACKHVGV